MSFIQENNITININLKKQYKIVHFSDVHVVTYNIDDLKEDIDKALHHENAWVRVRQDFAIHFKEKCNEEHLIKSTDCLNNLIEYNNKINPDLTLLTGDIIDYYSKSNYEYLKKSLLKINNKYLFACGNHETPSSLYKEITNNNNEINYIENDEFIVVSIDDSKKIINEYQYNTLIEITKINKPIIICMHIPIKTKYNELEMQKYDQYYIMSYESEDKYSKEFIQLVCNNENIKAILCGHTHGASVSYFFKDKPQYCASSGLIGYVNNIIVK